MRILNIFFLCNLFHMVNAISRPLINGLYHTQYKKGYFFKLDAFLLINKNKGYLNLDGSIQYSDHLNYTIDKHSNIIFSIPDSLKKKLNQYYSKILGAYITPDLCPVIIIKPRFLNPIKLKFKRCITNNIQVL